MSNSLLRIKLVELALPTASEVEGIVCREANGTSAFELVLEPVRDLRSRFEIAQMMKFLDTYLKDVLVRVSSLVDFTRAPTHLLVADYQRDGLSQFAIVQEASFSQTTSKRAVERLRWLSRLYGVERLNRSLAGVYYEEA